MGDSPFTGTKLNFTKVDIERIPMRERGCGPAAFVVRTASSRWPSPSSPRSDDAIGDAVRAPSRSSQRLF